VYVTVDLSTIPPVIELHEADDLRSLKVVVNRAEATYLAADTLRSLAGTRADDPEWQQRFAAMLEYAQDHGWLREDGHVQAHVESFLSSPGAGGSA
jgi:hypothetical protein